MARFAKTAAALLLLCGGGFLMYRGAQQYFGSMKAQRDAALSWRKIGPVPPKPPAGASGRNIRQPHPSFLPEGTLISRLDVPRLQKTLYVVEGSNAMALGKGAGHVRGSAMPGEKGNCVIAGHRDLQFRFLKDVRQGDEIQIQDSQGTFTYRVAGTKIISPTQIEVLQPTSTAQLNLITCYPFYFIGHAPKRFVVTANLEAPADQTVVAGNLMPLPLKQPHRTAPKLTPARPMIDANYEKSLEATHALNRAAAGSL